MADEITGRSGSWGDRKETGFLVIKVLPRGGGGCYQTLHLQRDALQKGGCGHHTSLEKRRTLEMRKSKGPSVLALGLLAALVTVGVPSAAPGNTDAALSASARLRKAVTPASILGRERRFQQIANDAEEGTRASGTPGYDASARCVAQLARGAGYEVGV